MFGVIVFKEELSNIEFDLEENMVRSIFKFPGIQISENRQIERLSFAVVA